MSDLKLGLASSYLLGGLAAAFFAAVIGYPLLRIRGAYFSIAMLAVAEGVRVLAGPNILSRSPAEDADFPVLAGNLTQQYLDMLLIAVLELATCIVIARNRFGLALIAIREDEAAADDLGVNTTATKLAAFVLSAFFAGTIGGVHATFVHYIDPTSAFDMKLTIMPIIMSIFGGLGTVLGPVIGGVLLEFVSDFSWLYLGRMNITHFRTDPDRLGPVAARWPDRPAEAGGLAAADAGAVTPLGKHPRPYRPRSR